MNIIKILEQIELYGADIITNDGIEITCKCRFNHKFICTNDNDWCGICETSQFNESLISEINTELEELDNNLKVLSIDKYGISTLKCKKKHFVNCDIDNIPNACNKCYLLNKSIDYEDDITKDDNILDTSNLLNYYNIPDECETYDEGDISEYELKSIDCSDGNNTDCDSVNSNGDNCCSDWLDKFNNEPGHRFNKETNYYDTFNLEIYEYIPMKYEEPIIHRPNNILYNSLEKLQ